MMVWMLGGKIIRTVLFCAVLCTTVVHSATQICEQFLNLLVGLGLDFISSFLCVCIGLAFCVFFVLA